MTYTHPVKPTILITDDPFTMASANLLLATDWRFQVVEKATTFDQWISQSSTSNTNSHILILAQEEINDSDLRKVQESAFKGKTVLLTGKRNLHSLRRIPAGTLNGVLVRQEIGYSLGWALDYACQGYWVTTPAALSWLPSQERAYFDSLMVLSQPAHPYDLTPRQEEAFWLGIILRLDHRTMAEELAITEGSSYGLISALYRRLDIDMLLRGESNLNEFIPQQEVLSDTYEKIQAEVKQSGTTHVRDKAELVFHLLTHPEIVER
jgi:DNA-binding NarL/FixJ family response regulator